MNTFLSVVVAACVLALAFLATRYRMQRDFLNDYALVQSRWIDEIIEALEDPDEDSGNESLDGLLDQRGSWRRLLDSGKVRLRD